MFKFSIFVFVLVGLSLLATGFVYLSLDEFMPYHEEAIQIAWTDLDPNFQGLILGLLKGLGSGAFVAGTAILFMAGVSQRKNPRPYLVLMPIVAISYSMLLCYATFTVYTSTQGNPPLLLNIMLVATSVLASITLTLSQRNNSDT